MVARFPGPARARFLNRTNRTNGAVGLVPDRPRATPMTDRIEQPAMTPSTPADPPSATPPGRGDGLTPRAGPREWLALAVLTLPTLMVSVDVFVMVLALPHLSASLHASSTEQLWVMDIYGFMVAGFMITMGTLGDRIGRRRLLLVAAAAFGALSVAAAYSPSAEFLIGSRALLGVAGAALTPSTLALITTIFRNDQQRATAIGIWAGAFTAGAIIGPILGGALLEHFWWGSVLLIGAPAMVLLLVTGPFVLPEFRDTTAGRVDVPSVALSLLAIMPAVYGLKGLATDGWGTVPLLALAGGGAIGIVFVRRQLRLPDPLLDVALFTGRTFSTTLAAMFAYTLLSGGVMVVVAQFLQLVGEQSPLQAGLTLMPGMLASIVSFQVSPLLARRISPTALLAAGLLLGAAGFLTMIMAAPDSSGIPVLVTGSVVGSLGSGPLVTLGMNLVIASAPQERAGSAAAIGQTANEFGYALGVAVVGSIVTAVYRTQVHVPVRTVSAGARAAIKDNLAGAVEAAHRLPATTADGVLRVAHDSFTSGLHVATGAASAALMGMAAFLLASRKRIS